MFHYILEWFFRMGGGAKKSVRIGSIPDNDFIDQVFEPSASRSDDGDKRHVIEKALFDEIMKELLVGYRRVQNDLASKRHEP